MKPVLYFDFISPFSFLLWQNAKKRGVLELFTPKPVVLARILSHWGQKPPSEIEPKHLYLYRSCLRYAQKNNIKLLAPKSHPFNSLYALRMAATGDLKLIDTLWEMTWQNRIEMSDPDTLRSELDKRGFNGQKLLDQTFEREVKNQLKENTKEALEHNVFGVPSIVYNKELFWGNDSLEDFLNFYNEADSLDRKLYTQIKESTLVKTTRFNENAN